MKTVLVLATNRNQKRIEEAMAAKGYEPESLFPVFHVRDGNGDEVTSLQPWEDEIIDLTEILMRLPFVDAMAYDKYCATTYPWKAAVDVAEHLSGLDTVQFYFEGGNR